MAKKLLIHIGKGAGRKTYTYEEEAVTTAEAILIEDETGLSWTEFKDAIQRNSVKAVVALVWVLRLREEPGLPLEQVVFKLGDLDSDAVDSEPTAPKEDSFEEIPPGPS